MGDTVRILDYALRRGGRTPDTLSDIDQFAWHWFHDPWESRPEHPAWTIMDDNYGWTLEMAVAEVRRIRLRDKVAPDILTDADLKLSLERSRLRELRKKASE